MTRAGTKSPSGRSTRSLLLGGFVTLVASVLLLLVHSRRTPPRAASESVPSRASSELFFESNRGQADPSVRYLARTRGGSIFLTADSAIISMTGNRPNGAQDVRSAQIPGRQRASVRIEFAEANPNPQIAPQEPLPGRVNYFVGSNPKNWVHDVPIFSRVLYRGVYPGIDVVYHASAGTIEYDFLVAPGADARTIKLDIFGSPETRIASNGSAIIQTPVGAITFLSPAAFQRDGGGLQIPVHSSLSLGSYDAARHSQRLNVEVARYDPTRPLVIDPQIVYSTFYGGSATSIGPSLAQQLSFLPSVTTPTQGDGAMDVAVGSDGMAYIAGFTFSNDLRNHSGSETGANAPPIQNPNAFVAKFNPNASGAASLIYATYLGGSGDTAVVDKAIGNGDQAYGIAVDGSGDAFVVGQTFSHDFPGTSQCGSWGQTNNAASGNGVGFVSQLGQTGSLTYSCYLDGAKGVLASRVALVPACMNSCQAFVVGTTRSSQADGFIPLVNPAQSTLNGVSNAFVALIGAGGQALKYSSYYGGSGQGKNGDLGVGIAVNSAQQAFITGLTFSGDLQKTTNAYQAQYKGATASSVCGNNGITANNTSNAFLAEFDPTQSGASTLAYSSYLGGTGAVPNGLSFPLGDVGTAIALVPGTKQVWVGGITTSCDLFPQGTNLANQNQGAPATAGFLAMLDLSQLPNGQLAYSRYFSGNGAKQNLEPGFPAGMGDGILDLGISADGRFIAATGFAFSSSNFPTSANACATVYDSQSATSFVAEFDSSHPNQLTFGRFLGGSGTADIGTGIAIDSGNHLLVSGLTYSQDFPTSSGGFQTTNLALKRKSTNAFLTVIDPTSAICGATATATPTATESATTTATAARTATATTTATPTKASTANTTATPTMTATATTNATATATVTATATMTPTPVPPVNASLSVSKPSVSFGNVMVGGRKSQGISLTNKAKKGATIVVENISVQPADSDFSVSATCTGTFPPKRSCKFTISFAPGTSGQKSAMTVINDNAENQSQQQITLTGTGVPPKKRK